MQPEGSLVLRHLSGAWAIGVIAVIILVGSFLVISAVSPPRRPILSVPPTLTIEARPRVASVGETVRLDTWEVTLLDIGPYERFDRRAPTTVARGTRLVTDLRITNLGAAPAIISVSDFIVTSATGATFEPVSETASIAGGFLVSQSVQPGLATGIRVVFDIDPSAQGLTLSALTVLFTIPPQ